MTNEIIKISFFVSWELEARCVFYTKDNLLNLKLLNQVKNNFRFYKVIQSNLRQIGQGVYQFLLNMQTHRQTEMVTTLIK